ncbi:MBL fold metallo-hydrolase [Streptomyces sp. ISL-44]|uniref:MBL fold metallo-hydrolase n=1 Tax=Streptomyces sp. ISL-44 TaxID=2819184 RepID=UPI001BE55102|nr:MBL fold metallo-hydrolase [Streptomyces sp. ISL-44]MBT2540244.1 MBL fold metallo-hydrolase [Streptomyces sp. ISL-44]
MIDFLADIPVAGSLDIVWHAGWPSPKHDPAPEIQIHAYTENTVILRQNKSVHYEAPFLFLLFGNESALLIDTGATSDPGHFPLRATVDALIEDWLMRNPRAQYGLTVAHTHGHGDHIAADGQFTDRPGTTVVGHGLDEVTAHFGLGGWPHRTAELDLGGRILDLVPGPGHHSAALVFYDRHTGLLLTGDSLYPGRLYVEDRAAYAETADRLLDFCATRPVTHVLGCHIEMTTVADTDYPRGTTYQPDEPPLQLTAAHLRTLRKALAETAGQPGSQPCGDFIVVYTS